MTPPPSPPWGHGLGEWGSPFSAQHKALTCGKQGNRVLTWLFGKTCGVTPLRLFSHRFSLLHTGFILGRMVWIVQFGGVCVQWGVQGIIPTLPIHQQGSHGAQGWELPPLVVRPSLLCSVQPWSGACRWYCSPRNKH